MTISHQLYANNAKTTLASSISNVATVIPISTGTGVKFPSPTGGDYFLVTIETALGLEVIKVTTRVGDSFTVCERNQEGTTSPTGGFPSGSRVECRVTQGTLASFARFKDRLDEISSIDLLSTPSNSNSNSYICQSTDFAGNPIVAIKKSASAWRFSTHTISFASTSVTAVSPTTTSINTTAAVNILSVTSGKYIIQFTSGVNIGLCRLVTGGGTNSVSWLTALPSAPASLDTFEIYKSDAAAFTDLATLAGVTNPVRFDSSTALPTTSFVKQSGIHTSGTITLSATTSLTAVTHCGKTINSNSTDPTCTFTLPLANFTNGDGETILFINTSSLPYKVQRNSSGGTDSLTYGYGSVYAIITPGDTLLLQSNGVSQWIPIGGSLALFYGSDAKASFRGGPFWVTQPRSDNSDSVATTKYVTDKMLNGNFAPINSPKFTGIPEGPAPTSPATPGQLTNYKFVKDNLDLKVNTLDSSLTGNATSATTPSVGDATTKVANTLFVSNALAVKAPLVSPTFTGVPLTPTATGGTNTTQIASTAFVTAAINTALPTLAVGKVIVDVSTGKVNTFKVGPTGVITEASWVAPAAGGGASILPTTNIWTGVSNDFQGAGTLLRITNGTNTTPPATATMGFDPAGLTTVTRFISANAGLTSTFTSNFASGDIFGLGSDVTRSAGAGFSTIGTDIKATLTGGTTSLFGARVNAISTGPTSPVVGLEVGVNASNTIALTTKFIGLNLVQAGANNTGSIGLNITRNTLAGTLGTKGWNKGISFEDGSLAASPTSLAYGIDFTKVAALPGMDVTTGLSSSVNSKNAYPMSAAIKLANYQSISWSGTSLEDGLTASFIRTYFNPFLDGIQFTNSNAGVDVHRFSIGTGAKYGYGSLGIHEGAYLYFQTPDSGIPLVNGVRFKAPLSSTVSNGLSLYADLGLSVGAQNTIGASTGYGPSNIACTGNLKISSANGISLNNDIVSAVTMTSTLTVVGTTTLPGGFTVTPTGFTGLRVSSSDTPIIGGTPPGIMPVPNRLIKCKIDNSSETFYIPLYNAATVPGF